MTKEECLFCTFAADLSKVKVIDRNQDFYVIENKYPEAPIDLLILAKTHTSKKDLQAGTLKNNFYQKALNFTHKVAKSRGLTKKGYEITMNFSGYNHFDHEHLHLLSGNH